MLKVAIQGVPGSNSDAAAQIYYHAQVTAVPTVLQIVPCERFQQAFELVEDGTCDQAFLPIENSTAGSVHRVYDLLQSQALHITGEYHHPVRHCLLTLPGVALSDIRRVISHEQALAQCRQFIDSQQWQAEVWYDTGGAAKDLAQQGWRDTAAIAPARAAEIYQLVVAAQGISNAEQNYTRFLALTRQPKRFVNEALTYKTSVVFHLPQNKAGGLFKALAVFALRDIDLTKLESRPMPHTPFNYLFYLDFKGRLDQPDCQRALANLSEFAVDVRVLGSYPVDESWV
jgi:arogenate/prephenate dehydratase